MTLGHAIRKTRKNLRVFRTRSVAGAPGLGAAYGVRFKRESELARDIDFGTNGTACYTHCVDLLQAEDIAFSHTTSLAERLEQALALMRQGIEIKRASLLQRFPHDTDEEIEQRLQLWLSREDG